MNDSFNMRLVIVWLILVGISLLYLWIDHSIDKGSLLVASTFVTLAAICLALLKGADNHERVHGGQECSTISAPDYRFLGASDGVCADRNVPWRQGGGVTPRRSSGWIWLSAVRPPCRRSPRVTSWHGRSRGRRGRSGGGPQRELAVSQSLGRHRGDHLCDGLGHHGPNPVRGRYKQDTDRRDDHHHVHPPDLKDPQDHYADDLDADDLDADDLATHHRGSDHHHRTRADDHRGDGGNDHLRQSHRPGRLAIRPVGHGERHSFDGPLVLYPAVSCLRRSAIPGLSQTGDTLEPMGYTDAPEGWWRKFVAALPAHTAKLAVVRTDGSPQVAPVWVDLDGDDIVFMTSANTVKGKAILRDPRVSLCWDDEEPPFSFVTVNGSVTLSTDRSELLYWATRIAGRYMGPNRAEDYRRRNSEPPEMVVRLRPSRIVAKINVAD